MIAVAHVMRNRVESGWYGGDWMAVLDSAEECLGTVYEAQPQTKLKDTNVRVFLQRIDDVFSGAEEDNTEGAVYYCELHSVQRDWFKENVLRQRESHPMVAQIGQVAFFS